ncbi:MAG: FAD-binding protein [Actinomycetia bacterium]|nr:FAD-binding protein [Actinomycetes bacterium]
MIKKLTRRMFLKGAALVGVGSAAAGLAACTNNAAGGSEPAATTWDGEYDVVVIGYGGAGANAAVAACEEGVKVLLIDHAPAGEEGGNTIKSGQFVMATDDANQLHDYLSKLYGKFRNWDDEALMSYCQGCQENFSWMTGPLGGDPEIICQREHPSQGSEATNNSWILFDNAWGLGRPGYIYNWHEFPEIESGKHCFCLTATGTRFDSGYYKLCQAAVNKRVGNGIDLWLAANGKQLLTDSDGAVIGVVIEKDGQDLKIKANGGVCLCTGGFEGNQEMISTFLQMPYVFQQGGLYNDGSGIKMAMSVGADLWHMSNSAGFSWTFKRPGEKLVTSGLTARNGIIVGLGGGRFMNETAQSRHGRIDIGGRWISTPMPLPSYLVQDAALLAAKKKLVGSFSDDYAAEIAAGDVISGATLEELADNIRKSNGGADAPNFSTEKFVAAVNSYNAAFSAGKNAEFGRPIDTMAPISTAPFYAVKIAPTYFNTQGGPRRNKFAQVVAINGLPIPGLFSAGEMGSVFADMYNGSGNLGETMVFGRYAGQNAAARAKGTFTGATEKAKTWQGEPYKA